MKEGYNIQAILQTNSNFSESQNRYFSTIIGHNLQNHSIIIKECEKEKILHYFQEAFKLDFIDMVRFEDRELGVLIKLNEEYRLIKFLETPFDDDSVTEMKQRLEKIILKEIEINKIF
ncbi:hypothetical protein [uncultured Helicobacter sp.]|uniref:hypothetical protein n=1 Tax=uncultured Helicobacter sp. TaxID=175537 RepID=UPI0026197945|nr:hypothetical protein [uncultured Helicobacter sp.]